MILSIFFQRSNKECLNSIGQVHHTTLGMIQRVVCNIQQSMVSAKKRQEFNKLLNHRMLKCYEQNQCTETTETCLSRID